MSDVVAFTTPDIARNFIVCDGCRRVMPHYRVYGRRPTRPDEGRCKCGGLQFRPALLPTWQAAWWLFVVGWLWRKTIRGEREWDPRVPFRTAHYGATR